MELRVAALVRRVSELVLAQLALVQVLVELAFQALALPRELVAQLVRPVPLAQAEPVLREPALELLALQAQVRVLEQQVPLVRA